MLIFIFDDDDEEEEEEEEEEDEEDEDEEGLSLSGGGGVISLENTVGILDNYCCEKSNYFGVMDLKHVFQRIRDFQDMHFKVHDIFNC